jgi:CSLREA domain-containing protein
MKTRSASHIVGLLILTFGVAVFGIIPAHATTLTVTKTADTNDGVCDADCSLREAIAAANDSDTINFSVTGVITLNSGELAIGKNITISGPGALSLAVDGNNASRVFHILAGETVTISNLTIRNGNSNAGGGIYNEHGTLTVNNCAVSGNTASSIGGGIYNDAFGGINATLTLNNCTVSGNFAGGNTPSASGGGIDQQAGNGGSASLAINNSTISGNTADSSVRAGGGAISSFANTPNGASISVNNSTITNNNTLTCAGGGAPLST